MIKQKPSLSAALQQAARPLATHSVPAPSTELTPANGTDGTRRRRSVSGATVGPPSRKGKRAVAGYFSPVVARQLRQLAAQLDRTQQSLLAEALDDLFERYGKARIAVADDVAV